MRGKSVLYYFFIVFVWHFTYAMDPDTAHFLAQRKPERYLGDLSLTRFRSNETLFIPPAKPEIYEVIDFYIDGNYGPVPLRMYKPNNQRSLPVALFFHGGGWVWGSLQSHDALCRSLCNELNTIIVAVDYHLAPEYPFPAAFNDCYTAFLWVANTITEYGGNADALSLIGDSSGGTLAAAVSLAARDRNGPKISYQLLLYPALDTTCDYPSHHEFARGYFLTTQNMEWFWRTYISHETEYTNPYAVPMRAQDLSNLPPTFIIIAEYDPLRDEAFAFAQRLIHSHVTTHVLVYPSCHCFMSFAHFLSIGNQAVKEIACSIKTNTAFYRLP